MRVFIVDDHVLFSDGLVSMLESQPDFTVVGRAGSVKEAIETIPNSGAELVLMDINLPDGNGMDAAAALLMLQPELRVVILTVYEADDLLFNAVRSGVKGYILKSSPKAHFLSILRAVARGEVGLTRAMTGKLVEEFSRVSKIPAPEEDRQLELLTYREIEILRLLGENATNREIAGKLNITENTVKSHVHNILDKLKVMNRQEAGKFARRIAINGSDFPSE